MILVITPELGEFGAAIELDADADKCRDESEAGVVEARSNKS